MAGLHGEDGLGCGCEEGGGRGGSGGICPPWGCSLSNQGVASHRLPSPPALLCVQAGCLSTKVLPPIASLVEAFRRCCLDVAPLAACVTIPPRHINNFVEYQVGEGG